MAKHLNPGKTQHPPRLEKGAKCMKTLFLLTLSLFLLGGVSGHAEEVEITGTFQIQISCADTHHEVIALVEETGNGRISGKQHALNIDRETQEKFKIGQKVTVKGRKKPFSTKKMTKGQIRKLMVEHTRHGRGLPVECSQLGEIISKIQIEKPAPKQPGAHNHGELKLKPMDDDNEVVEVNIMEHIEVTRIEAINLEGAR
jgi:hypothetical protein